MRDGSEVFLKQFTNGLTTSVFTGETGVIVGTDKGEVVDVDLRNTRQPIRTLITSSEVTSLQMAESRKCIMATADGSCFVWDTQLPDVSTLVKLTGPQSDRVTAVRSHMGSIWTTCRDGVVRLYSDVESLCSQLV
jgi:WD40 repeat protein